MRDRLPTQDQLVREFGVSYPSVREAMRILETEGLVTVRRGSVGGAEVHRPDQSSAAYHLGLVLQGARVTLGDLAAGLLLLEPLCAAEVARRADRADGRRPRADRQRRRLGRGGVRRRRVHPDRPRVPRSRRRVHARTTPCATWCAASSRCGRRRSSSGRRRVTKRGEYPSAAAGARRGAHPPAARRRDRRGPRRRGGAHRPHGTSPPRRRCCSSASPTTSSTPRRRGPGCPAAPSELLAPALYASRVRHSSCEIALAMRPFIATAVPMATPTAVRR